MATKKPAIISRAFLIHLYKDFLQCSLQALQVVQILLRLAFGFIIHRIAQIFFCILDLAGNSTGIQIGQRNCREPSFATGGTGDVALTLSGDWNPE